MSVDAWTNAWTEKEVNDLAILNDDIPFQVYHKILNTKIDIDDILSQNNLILLKNHFELLWIKSYYDFIFYWDNKIKKIINDNPNIKSFFMKVVWKENLNKSSIGSKAIWLFADRIWFKRWNFDDLKNKVLEDLKEYWIETLNEFQVYVINDFVPIIRDNNHLKFLVFRYYERLKNSKKIWSNNIKGWYTNILAKDFEKIGAYLWLRLLDEEEIKIKLREKFKEKGIIYLDDIDKLNVLNMRDLVDEFLLLRFYFLDKWKHKSDILHDDISELWIDIWLKNKEIKISEIEYVKKYLSNNGINSYSDFIGLPTYEWYRIKPHIEESRNILLSDKVCRKLLIWFWMKKSQDFILDHIKKISRYIWFTDVPNDFEYDEKKSIEEMTSVLKSNWVNCIYSLKLFWLKWFRRIFKQKVVWKIVYNDVSTFIKKKFNVVISELKYSNLEELWELLWLEILDTEEHKRELMKFLTSEWETLKTITKTKIKTQNKFWRNPHLRYFLKKVWVATDVKKLRVPDIVEMKRVVEEVINNNINK